MNGNVIDARELFSERAQAVVEEAELMKTAYLVAEPEVDWYLRQGRGYVFLRAMGLDVKDIPIEEPPDDLVSNDPAIEEIRQTMHKLMKMKES